MAYSNQANVVPHGTKDIVRTVFCEQQRRRLTGALVRPSGGISAIPVRSTVSCNTSMKESDVMSSCSFQERCVLSLSKG